MGTVSLDLEPVLQEKGISLDELAMQAGIEDNKADKIKRGQVSAIRFTTLASICDVLDCEPGVILGYTN